MTSGATAEMIARCLLKAGAKSVEVWVVARA
jgi:predicted amidophosphoribosyltransferase